MGAKREKAEGAPAYMGLFTSLMTVLLAFFIILNSLAATQEAGFNDGIGQVKNAFGIKGGIGLMQFSLFRVGKDAIPVPEELREDNEGDSKAFDIRTQEETGGAGNVNYDYKDSEKVLYFAIELPYQFKDGSAEITDKIKGFLNVFGITVSLFNLKFAVRSYCKEEKEKALTILNKGGEIKLELPAEKLHDAVSLDESLAYRRARNVVDNLIHNRGFNYSQIEITATAFPNYLEIDDPSGRRQDNVNRKAAWDELGKQAIYFYVFNPGLKKKSQ